MHKTSKTTRGAMLLAVVLAAGAVAVPTAAACPLDPYDNCLVVSPDRDKVAGKVRGKGLVVSPDRDKVAGKPRGAKTVAPHLHRIKT